MIQQLQVAEVVTRKDWVNALNIGCHTLNTLEKKIISNTLSWRKSNILIHFNFGVLKLHLFENHNNFWNVKIRFFKSEKTNIWRVHIFDMKSTKNDVFLRREGHLTNIRIQMGRSVACMSFVVRCRAQLRKKNPFFFPFFGQQLNPMHSQTHSISFFESSQTFFVKTVFDNDANVYVNTN